jgi:hypothetical protein
VCWKRYQAGRTAELGGMCEPRGTRSRTCVVDLLQLSRYREPDRGRCVYQAGRLGMDATQCVCVGGISVHSFLVSDNWEVKADLCVVN